MRAYANSRVLLTLVTTVGLALVLSGCTNLFGNKTARSDVAPPPAEVAAAALQALSASENNCVSALLEPERAQLLQAALSDSKLQAVQAQLERRGVQMNSAEALALKLPDGEQLLIPFGERAHLVWTRINGQTAALGLLRQGNKTLNLSSDGSERVVKLLEGVKVSKLLQQLRGKSKFKEFEERLRQKGKRLGKIQAMLDETGNLAILGLANEGSEKIAYQVRTRLKNNKDDELADGSEPEVNLTLCGKDNGESLASVSAKPYIPLAMVGEEYLVGGYGSNSICTASRLFYGCYIERARAVIAPPDLYALRRQALLAGDMGASSDLVGLVGPDANMILAGFGTALDNMDLEQFYAQAINTSASQPAQLPCSVLFKFPQYQAVCEALNTLIGLLGPISSNDLRAALESLMQWLINNPNGNLLSTVTNLYHPSPSSVTLQAYKSFIDALTGFFAGQGQTQQQAKDNAFKTVANAIKVIHAIYNNDGDRLKALLELNARTKGFGLIAIAQLNRLKELPIPDYNTSPEHRWLRLVIKNSADMQALVNVIINGPFAGWGQLNDLLRYYYTMAQQAIDNNGLATANGTTGLEGVARATFLLGMASRFLDPSHVPAGTKFEIFKLVGTIVVDFRIGTWTTARDGSKIDTRIFGYMEPFLNKQEVDSMVQRLQRASQIIANYGISGEYNPHGINVLVQIIDSAEAGAVQGVCDGIRGRSWSTPVVVITQGGVACIGGSLTQAQANTICLLLGICGLPYQQQDDIIRSIKKGTFSMPGPTDPRYPNP